MASTITVRVLGRTGGGKTTIANLIYRVLKKGLEDYGDVDIVLNDERYTGEEIKGSLSTLKKVGARIIIESVSTTQCDSN